MKAPVAFIFFNRPTTTQQVFARIREWRPSELFLISDGPRVSKEGESERVLETRTLVEGMIDWPCTVHKAYASANMGCRQRIASGLDWVFSKVEECIILEDDCLPAPDFFGFCSTLLARYRSDERVMHIGGCNIAHQHRTHAASYWFTHHPWIWGWATWRRAWRLYDFNMTTWAEREAQTKKTFATEWETQFWMSQWRGIAKNIDKATTWDFPWMFTCRSTGGLCILPTQNLVCNLGFGGDSTHTGEDLKRLDLSTASIGELVHPRTMSIDAFSDELVTRLYANEKVGGFADLKSRLRIGKKWALNR